MGNSVRPQGHVIGPGGNILTCADLPPRNTRRWVPRRKAEVIAAVDGGLLTLNDACVRYEISHEEFRAWVQAYSRHGLAGLRAGQLMDRWKTERNDHPVN
jgi:transposase-like protein